LEFELSLKNQFLLAMPGLTGSYFGNTITYICEHNDQGAMGLMVNRPTELALTDLLDQLNIAGEHAPIEIPVLEGGPVAADRGFILHTSEKKFVSSLDLGDGLILTTAREVLEAIATGDGPDNYLVALGYAGWAGGQLEAEMQDNSWLNCPASREVLFDTPFEARVGKAAQSLGIDFSLISGHAGHS
jgi:putative transcriptional regulator